MSEQIQQLLQRPDIWRGDEQLDYAGKYIPSGFAELDEQLPGGGWPTGALSEIIMAREGIGEMRLLMPALARMSHEGRWLAWVAPPYIPYAPALAACGVNLSRVLLVHPRANSDGLWAVEQALRSGTCGAVLAWMAVNDQRRQRRLQLAAEAGGTMGILFRSERTASRTSCAALRLHVDTTHHGRVTVNILKRRGGWASRPVSLKLDSGFVN
jgi:cell division inhibitor SulA/protein ImuA